MCGLSYCASRAHPRVLGIQSSFSRQTRRQSAALSGDGTYDPRCAKHEPMSFMQWEPLWSRPLSGSVRSLKLKVLEGLGVFPTEAPISRAEKFWKNGVIQQCLGQFWNFEVMIIRKSAHTKKGGVGGEVVKQWEWLLELEKKNLLKQLPDLVSLRCVFR